jgi:ATP-dependent protease ClpP protease subunit
VQTVGIGYMASMGGVLLAAGATNVIGEESWVLVHRAAGWFGGTTEEIVDAMKRLERLQNEECFAILASRKRRWPKSSRKRGIDVKEIKKRCDRGDWWVPARIAKRLGLVDEVF